MDAAIYHNNHSVLSSPGAIEISDCFRKKGREIFIRVLFQDFSSRALLYSQINPMRSSNGKMSIDYIASKYYRKSTSQENPYARSDSTGEVRQRHSGR